MVIGRSSRLTHFLEWREYKIVFRRYASLYFAACIEKDDNELIVLDVIHHFVEVLDRYFLFLGSTSATVGLGWS